MEKLKKNPTSVRFDKEKMDFIKEKENLSTVQKVFTFLLDKYWWERQVGINPVLERQDELTKWAKSTELGKLSQKVANESMSTFKVRNFSPNGSIEGIYTEKDAKSIENLKSAGISYSNVEIERLIAEIRAEKIPAHRNTSIGKKSWEIEQLNRINELEKK